MNDNRRAEINILETIRIIYFEKINFGRHFSEGVFLNRKEIRRFMGSIDVL
ncbi:MAG: hypothetical protein NTX38_05210 [Methylobacter sp.]|nr:hypothetical protein [Methylobacter sp.]